MNSPLISAVICVFNDAVPLEKCLKSFVAQKSSPSFEVVVIDDGCEIPLQESLNRLDVPFPLRFIRQVHAGLPTARNTGMRAAVGSVVLFTDADCILDRDCLHNLSKQLSDFPTVNCFQLCLVGDGSHIVGRAEQLHLSAIQARNLEPSGHIRYLNTSGAALRRSKILSDDLAFDLRATRAEDTLLLSNLIRAGEMPRYISSAIVVHDVRLPVWKYLWKGLWAGYLEGAAYEIIKSSGVEVRSTWRDRCEILSSMRRESARRSWRMVPFMIVIIRQSLSFLGSFSYRWLGRFMLAPGQPLR